jgi:hypothetical protein
MKDCALGEDSNVATVAALGICAPVIEKSTPSLPASLLSSTQ